VESETIGYTVPSAMAGYYLNFFDMPVEPFVRFGLASIEDSPSGNLETDKQNSVSFAWGAGLDWRFAKHFKLRGVVETYDKDAAIASVSVAYIFGEAKVAAKPVAPAPKAEPKPEPKPEPVVEAKPEPAPPAQSAEVKKLFSGSLKGVNFKAGSAELLPESRTTLMDAAAVLKEYPDLQVDVNAYTCNDGSKEFNLKLSQQRADKVKSFFVEQGVDRSRLKATGYGKDYPLVPNTSEENKAKNRRVELKQRNS
jgi:outer membrane protein OmpA-like peptidoglycan-associated protein